MPLEYYTLSRDDARLMADLQFGGYSDDPVSAAMYPLPASNDSKADTARRTAESWGKNPNEHVLAVRDTELDEVISWAHWFVEPEKRGEEWMKFDEDRDCPPEWDRGFFLDAMRKNWEKKVEIMGSKPYICKSSEFSCWSSSRNPISPPRYA